VAPPAEASAAYSSLPFAIIGAVSAADASDSMLPLTVLSSFEGAELPASPERDGKGQTFENTSVSTTGIVLLQ